MVGQSYTRLYYPYVKYIITAPRLGLYGLPLLTDGETSSFTKIIGLSLRVEGIRYSERLDKRTTRTRMVLRNKRLKIGALYSEDKGDKIAVDIPVPDNKEKENEDAVFDG